MKSRAHRYRYVRHVAMSCFPDGRASVAPPTLSYATPQSWTYGVAITTLSPTTTGATSFAVQSGALPTGVSLNAGNGNITGTPTTAKVAANVVIRATGPGGTADATINIAVPSPLYTSLVDYWNLDEASGNRAGSHAGLTLTDVNTVTSQATGGPDGGRCSQFTAANSEYLSRASETALQTGDVDFTFAAWVYPDDFTNPYNIIGKDSDAVGAREYGLETVVAGTKIRGYVFAAVDSKILVNCSETLSASTWYFTLFQHDAAADAIGVSINNGALTTAATGGSLQAASTAEFSIGRRQYTGSNQYNNGRTAYVGMWKRKLTAAEKTWLYNSGAGRAYSALATYDGG